MISITVQGEERVQNALNKLKQLDVIVYSWMKGGQPDKIMQQSFLQNFSSQGRPKWENLAEETIQERQEKGFSRGPILVRTGNLKDEVTSLRGKVTTAAKEVQMEWGIDQLRSQEKAKFAGHQKGVPKRGLPARPMVGFQTKDGKAMVNSLRTWILMQLK